MSKPKLGVLIVEDSESLLQLLVRTIERDANLEVKGVARNGQEAIDRTLQLKPDVITMDLNMPKVDGYEAIRQIMAQRPTPIVVVTSVTDSKASFEAIRAGALEVVSKPLAMNTPEGVKSLQTIVETIKIMAGVKVITRKTSLLNPNQTLLNHPSVGTTRLSQPTSTLPSSSITRQLPDNNSTAKIVAIASSTGGPPALNKVLSNLSENFPLPILIVQHITAGFGAGLVNWLKSTLTMPVQEAQEGMLPLPGNIYIAPDNAHLLIASTGRLKLSNGLPIKGHRPSATLLFESVANFYGPTAMGIILTGMGDDGLEGLKVLRKERGYCIAQDEASSVVYGMPKAVVDAGLANQVLGVDEIGHFLHRLGVRIAPHKFV